MGHYVFDDQRELFDEKISFLKGLGQFVSTSDMIDMMQGTVPIDGNYFHLSFDDGLECLLRNAAPILDSAQIPTLVFVNSALADKPTNQEREQWEVATNYAKPLRVMNWSQLKESGFEVGAHTRTHLRLKDISDDIQLLTSEINGCKSEIEASLGMPCRYFAWPFGSYMDIDATSYEVIKKAGFDASFSAVREPIIPGATDPFMIPRNHFEPQWPLNHMKYFFS
jgi:peptidoglycan/xylan/chitin deacetylase (PgdA/CDA1 family)